MSPADAKRARRRRNNNQGNSSTNSSKRPSGKSLSRQHKMSSPASHCNGMDNNSSSGNNSSSSNSSTNGEVPFSFSPLQPGYSGSWRCLLCRAESPGSLPVVSSESPVAAGGQQVAIPTTLPDSVGTSLGAGLFPSPLWVCQDCRHRFEEKQLLGSLQMGAQHALDSAFRPAATYDGITEQEKGDLAVTNGSQSTESVTAPGLICNCEACRERR
uniref:Uncharacterized protein n=1 Tax=Eptatretus burgeri TaxID=7764 RepID=A0A8C4Q478_EPTBU